MVFDEGPSFEERPQSNPHFVVSWTELVSRTFTLWGRKLISYLAIASIPVIVSIVLNIVILWLFFGSGAAAFIGLLGTDVLTLLLSILMAVSNPLFFVVSIALLFTGVIISAIVSGAVIKLALDNYGAPERGDARDSLSFAFGRIITIIGVQIVVSFILIAFMLPGITMLLLGLLTYDFLMISYSFLAILLGVTVGYYLSIRLSAASAVVIAEDLSAIGSLKRAFALSSGEFWHILAGTFLLAIAVGIVSYIATYAAIPLVLLSGGNILTMLIFTSIVLAAARIITMPISQIFLAVLYRDLAEREHQVTHVW
ncbi:MAG: hypothetical protein P1Q69_11710 [Candidatus Thorarchaeota archaeon]|nr:hypothetical protein [Candidatus Thorarchaeota archaeon]